MVRASSNPNAVTLSRGSGFQPRLSLHEPSRGWKPLPQSVPIAR